MMPGFPGIFLVFFVFVFVAGIGTTIWRISIARNMAARAGLDQNAAAAVSMLSPNGIDATYLASSLASRPPYPPPYPAVPVQRPKTAEQRLEELLELKDKGLITEDEFLERRQHILDSI